MQHLLRPEVREQFVDIIAVSLAGEELTRRDIEERHADQMLVEMQARHPVVLLLRERRVRITDARRDELRDTALDEFLRQFGILQLVAYRDAQTRPHEFGQVGVEGMERKARHLCRLLPAVIAVREGDGQDFRCLHRILRVGLVEVAATEEQHRIRILRFDVAKLLHHRSYFIFIIHKNSRLVYS